MSAFRVFHSTVKDPEKFQAYAQSVGPTLAPFEGTVVQKGKNAGVLEGAHRHEAVGILKFPDLDKAVGWYRSADYQALVPNRNAAAELTVISYEEPVAYANARYPGIEARNAGAEPRFFR
jgi:uncharacterized protein (DUF1330 family)